MKRIIIISATFLSLNVFGQDRFQSEKEPFLKVVYLNENSVEERPACFLNGKHIDESVLNTLQPEEVETIKIEKEDVEIDKVKYFGKIIIQTKESYEPIFLSLNQLKSKYTNCKEGVTIFEIDNEVIKADYDKYLVDANFILKITVDKLDNSIENFNLNVVKIYTKSEENIKNESQIKIRGSE